MNVVAVVRHAPMPDIPPAHLGPGVVPVIDETGATKGWELRVLDALADPDGARMLQEFSAWRSTFETVYGLGSRSSVEAFQRRVRDLADAAGEHVEALSTVRFGLDQIRGTRARALAADLGTARDLLVGSGGHGWGLVDTSPPVEGSEPVRGLVRAEAPGGGPVTEVRGAAVTVSVDGFVLRWPDGCVTLASYRLEGSSYVAVDADGVEHTIADPYGRVLSWLAPSSMSARVKRIPLTSVWAPVLAGLSSALARAEPGGHSVTVSDPADGGPGVVRVC